jgi:hypothetical protein
MQTASKSEMLASVIGAIGESKAAKFASFVYTAEKSGEVARHRIILNADTENLYLKDIAILEELIPTLTGIAKIAGEEVLASRRKSLEVGVGNHPDYVHSKDNADTFVATGVKGIKIHRETGVLYVNALTMGKDVITPGTYKVVNSAPKTIAKKKIENDLPSGKFRLFKLPNITRARLNGDTMELVEE